MCEQAPRDQGASGRYVGAHRSRRDLGAPQNG